MLRWTIPCLLLILSAGCGPYDIKVNDTVVFTPAPLYTDFDIADSALRECLEQAVLDQSITAPAQLQTLSCSHAGIVDLDGLAVFTGLTQLKLSSNQVRNLVELASLSMLQDLYLDGNNIVDPVPLYQLAALRTLDLSGNDELQCPVTSALLQIEELTLPQHCPR